MSALLLPRGDALALVYGMVISFAYIIQVQSAAWHVRFINRIFGSPPTSEPA